MKLNIANPRFSTVTGTRELVPFRKALLGRPDNKLEAIQGNHRRQYEDSRHSHCSRHSFKTEPFAFVDPFVGQPMFAFPVSFWGGGGKGVT